MNRMHKQPTAPSVTRRSRREEALTEATGCLDPVAQIFNLLYLRLAAGWRGDESTTALRSSPPQVANLRYSRVQLCATSASVIVRPHPFIAV